MSLTISRAISHVRGQLPSNADVTSVGDTIYARNIDRKQAERIDGDEIDGQMISLVDYFSGENKFVYKLETDRLTVTA